LGLWEPRLKLERLRVVSVLGGQINMQISGEYLGVRGTLEVWV
jgi:phage baseplate assembly protein W